VGNANPSPASTVGEAGAGPEAGGVGGSAGSGTGGSAGALSGSGGTSATGGTGEVSEPGTPGVEVCEERRDLVDLIWSAEDTRRLECNVNAVQDSLFGLSFSECVADAERCIAAGPVRTEPPAWDCETLAGDGTVRDEDRSEANRLLDQCFEEWLVLLDGIKATASCEALVENPLSIASTAVTVGLLVSAPGVIQPASCREYNEKYGGNGGGDLD